MVEAAVYSVYVTAFTKKGKKGLLLLSPQGAKKKK